MLSPDRLHRRNRLVQAIRSFFSSRGYLEVHTPIRQPVLLPESQILPIPAAGWFLQSSPEQCMKRLLATGNPQLFQICPCFRKNEQGRLHAEEFTMLEWYHSGWSYRELMAECESLLPVLALEDSPEAGTEGWRIHRAGRRIDLWPPWPRLSVEDAFVRHAGITVGQALAGDSFDQILVEQVEPHLGWGKPCFLVDYPAELASLARRKPGNPLLAERFELYIAGIELANGFSELVDPAEQEARFVAEIELMRQNGVEQGGLPHRFLQALSGLGECAGIALGVDRLLLLLWGASALREVAVFDRDDLLEDFL